MFPELDIMYILCTDVRKGIEVASKHISRESGDPNLVVPDFKATSRGQMEVKEYVAINSRFQENLVVSDFKATSREQMEVKEYVAINSRFQEDSSGQKSTSR